MKRNLMVWCVMVAAYGAVAQTATNTPAATRTNAVLGVERYMRGVEHYKGRVEVKGVVQKVAAKTQTVALIDVEEFRHCGLADCAELVLPVRWSGKLPEPGQAVQVTGEVQKANGKLVFVASELEKVELPEKKK